MPERQEGHLLKKRKWPLKGWHKVGCQGKGGATRGICWPARAFMRAAGEDNCVFALSLPRALGCLVLPRPYRGTLCLRMGSSTMPQRDKT